MIARASLVRPPLALALAAACLLSACVDPVVRHDAARADPQPAAARSATADSGPRANAGPRESPERAVRESSVPSPYRISEKAAKGTIRYRIRMRDGVDWPWPETGEQHVERDGDTVVLTICTSCGREAPPTAAALQRGLQPNPWLDSDDPVIHGFAIEGRGQGVHNKMQHLIAAVQERMNGPVSYGKYASAREAWEDREGDCTQYALLLAAAAQARRIPVRVVFGLSYASRFEGSNRVFAPHMWVQAWDGQRWTSYDAGLGAFDATHIALAVGDGRPEAAAQVFAKLRDVQIVAAEGVLPALAVER